MSFRTVCLALIGVFLLASAGAQLAAPPLTYPTSRQGDQIDNYHGTQVPDPYRWLEDDNSAETKAWVQAQNAVTEKYFAAMPQRAPARRIYTELFNFERFGVPFKEGGRYFWTRNDGLQQQAVLFTASSLTACVPCCRNMPWPQPWCMWPPKCWAPAKSNTTGAVIW